MTNIATEPIETPTSPTETDPLLSVVEVAKRLGISKATAYRLLGSGQLPALRIGGSLRVDPHELRVYVFGPEPEVAETDDVELDELAELLDRDSEWIERAARHLPSVVSASGRLRVPREALPVWQSASEAEA